jgi:hypothetical protein
VQQHLGGNAQGGLMAPSSVGRGRSLRLVRLFSVAVAVCAVAALCAIAVSGADPVIKKTTVKRVAISKTVPGTAPTTPSIGADTDPSTTTANPSTLVAAAPLPSSPVTSSATATVATPAAATVAATPSPASGPTTPTPVGSGLTTSDLPACPLPLAAPSNPGGLQSLVPLAPMFGPFSSEAFAAAPLFAPLLQPIGPFLVAFATAYASNSTAVAPLVVPFEALESQGFNFLSPLYGPYRSQFLQAESNLATALTPLAKAVGENQGTSCLVDIEALLAEAAPAS